MNFRTYVFRRIIGLALAAFATAASVPAARAEVASVAAPQSALFGVLVVMPLLLYALMRYEENGFSVMRRHSDLPSHVADVRAELEKQFSQFRALLREQLSSSERHSNALDHLSGRLGNAHSAAELQAIIQKLIASNEAYKRETAELEHQLEKAQKQAKELKQRAARAERLASVDPLTNISNRRSFDEELTRHVRLSHREETPLCLIMIDIDHFKWINDRFGHTTGDAILVQFAELLSKMVRGTDLVARYGGEEFAVILPRAPLGNAYEIAERIRIATQTCAWRNIYETDISLTSSFGIADIRDGETAGDLVNRADQMLYEAKRKGRNRTIITHSAA